jgi:GT2 family glycosyltransferase
MRSARPATVVVCSRDRPDALARCLKSVAEAVRAGDEVIVVESGMPAESSAAAPSLLVPYRHLRSADRRKSAKLNLAARHATGGVLLLTDDDCQVPPGWVQAMTEAFEMAPRVAVAFGPVLGLTSLPGGRPAARLAPGPAPQENWAYAHGASMAVLRSSLFDVGGFDERLGPGSATQAGEEADLVVRLVEQGWACVIADAPAVTHDDWRDTKQTLANLVVYEQGAGAWLGAGLRRSPARSVKLLLLRLRYQAQVWTDGRDRPRYLGPRTTAAFLTGLARGLTYKPRRFL